MSEPALSDRRWRLIEDEARDGPTQMAIEEVAAKTALENDIRTVRVFSWEPSTLSLGYHQEPETVDWEWCSRNGVGVTRRQTGGGGIYHDSVADISYTIVAPAEEVPGDLMACYELFCEPILEAFSRMGVEASFAENPQNAVYQPSCYLRDVNPAHDIVVDGEKISGNAQYRQRDVVIQHGSVSYDLEPQRHVAAFDTDLDVEHYTDRVTSVRAESGIDRETAVETLAETLGEWCDAERSSWRGDELEAARELADRKYGYEGWVRDREPLETN